MNGLRQAPIPIDHVIAEIAAYPLVAAEGLPHALTELDPKFPTGHASTALWRDTERSVLSASPAFSVDEVVAIRDWLWFGGGHSGDAPQERVPLTDYLVRLAQAYLEPRGGVAIPIEPRPSGSLAPQQEVDPQLRGRQFFRWLTFALPADLLLAALAPTADTGPDRIELLTPSVRRMLEEQGFAETHLHLGAALGFPELWVTAMHAIGSATAEVFAGPGAALDEGRQLGPWLLRAAIARLWLADHLRYWQDGGTDALGLRLREVRLPRTQRQFGGTVRALVSRAVLRQLRCGQSPTATDQAQLACYYRELGGLARLDLGQSTRGVHLADPLAQRLPPSAGPTPEMAFIRLALRYLQERTKRRDPDPVFGALFWQVVRVRGVFYRHVVQRPMTPGLQWFVRFFSRMRPAKRSATTELFVLAAAESSGAGGGLRSLEVRTAPDARLDAAHQLVRDAERVAESLATGPRSVPEVALVLHFAKNRGDDAEAGRPLALGSGGHSNPKKNASRYRYSEFYKGWRAQALTLATLFRSFPGSLRLIRGIDVCTDELGVPTWVLVPLFHYLQRESEAVSAASPLTGRPQAHMVRVRRDGSDAPRARRPPPACPAGRLRLTAHVGEDFVHLLGGLRRVDEALTYLKLESGDRIGHGIALGTSPRRWADAAGRIALTREERLLDLTWEFSCNARQVADTQRTSFLEREVSRLSTCIFAERLSPTDLEELVAGLHDPTTLRRVGFPDRSLTPLSRRSSGSGAGTPPSAHTRTLERLHGYLTLPAIYRRGQVIEWVETAAEAEPLEGLQLMLREKVARRGITVEVNPSSNLLIGHLADLQEHPMWRLRPPTTTQGTHRAVAVCIGSDDPLTFATTLPQEYQLLADTMASAGLGECEVRAWLEDACKAGLRARFSVPTATTRALLTPATCRRPARVRSPP